jgi:hypothetical protein
MALTKVGAGVLNIDDLYGFRNRIINGDMRIDQRNAGASVDTVTSGISVYSIDRWAYIVSTTSKFTLQQSSDAPPDFTNSLLITSSSAYSSSAGDFLNIRQMVEGFNFEDLNWGAANAKNVTLSFWVKSSLTGYFSGSLQNSAFNRSYIFSYNISSANTWEFKTVTIPGDTSGTWLKRNLTGCRINFNIGSGSNFLGTDNSWSSSNLRGATGSVSITEINGATWQITGVQLEVGTVATPFERRPFGTELALCQRYFQKSYRPNAVPGSVVGTNAGLQNSFATAGTGIIGSTTVFPVVMRTEPTLVVFDNAGNSGRVTVLDSGAGPTDNISLNTSNASESRMMVRIFGVSAAGISYMYTVSAEL